MNRSLVAVLATFALLFPLTASVPAAALDSDQAGHLRVTIASTNETRDYAAVLNGGRIYLAAATLAHLADYEVDEDVRDSEAYFARKDNSVTWVWCHSGSAFSMGQEFPMAPIRRDGALYYDTQKMLHLLHAQWSSADKRLIVQPIGNNLLDFWIQKSDYIAQNSIGLQDLLMNGESELGFAFRTVTASVFSEINVTNYYAPWAIEADYEEALLLLSGEDVDVLDATMSARIDALMEKTEFEQLKTSWELFEFSGGQLPKDLAELSTRFRAIAQTDLAVQFDIRNSSLLTSSAWQDVSHKLEVGGHVADVLTAFAKLADVLTRSANWVTGYAEQLDILANIDASHFGGNATKIKKVASGLVAEKRDPLAKANQQLPIVAAEGVANSLIDLTSAGSLTAAIGFAMTVARKVPGIGTKIEIADQMNTVNRLTDVEAIALREAAQRFERISVASRTEQRGPQSPAITVDTVEDFRDSVMLLLRTTLRNKSFVYRFNAQLNKTPNWTAGAEAKAMREDLCQTYVLLIELMNTAGFDRMLALGGSNAGEISKESGAVRSEIEASFLRPGSPVMVKATYPDLEGNKILEISDFLDGPPEPLVEAVGGMVPSAETGDYEKYFTGSDLEIGAGDGHFESLVDGERIAILWNHGNSNVSLYGVKPGDILMPTAERLTASGFVDRSAAMDGEVFDFQRGDEWLMLEVAPDSRIAKYAYFWKPVLYSDPPVAESGPRITEEEAANLCRKHFGTVAEENGFKLGYFVGGTWTEGDGEYYIVRAAWLVEDSHWSTINYYFVAVDGSKIHEATSSGNDADFGRLVVENP